MTPLLDSVAQVCRAHGTDLMELYELLYAALPDMVPEGHQLATCGNCHRHGIIPTGAMLRRLREECGATQREIAKSAAVSVPHVHLIETGRRNASDAIVAVYRGLISA